MNDRNRVLEAHRLAMSAKHVIFKAQDSVSAMQAAGKGNLRRRLERRLAKVRAELEALDREVRNVVDVDAPLGAVPKAVSR